MPHTAYRSRKESRKLSSGHPAKKTSTGEKGLHDPGLHREWHGLDVKLSLLDFSLYNTERIHCIESLENMEKNKENLKNHL